MSVYHGHATAVNLTIATIIAIDEKKPVITADAENRVEILPRRKKPSSPPYVKDAIASPISTSGPSAEVKSEAPPASMTVQTKESSRELARVYRDGASLLTQSDIVDEARALMDELSDDMAAEKIAATISPLMPVGSASMMKVEKTSLLFNSFPA